MKNKLVKLFLKKSQVFVKLTHGRLNTIAEILIFFTYPIIFESFRPFLLLHIKLSIPVKAVFRESHNLVSNRQTLKVFVPPPETRHSFLNANEDVARIIKHFTGAPETDHVQLASDAH